MTNFVPIPLPYNPRFATKENAVLFLKTRDPRLAIPVYIKEGETQYKINPIYRDAPFELVLVGKK